MKNTAKIIMFGAAFFIASFFAYGSHAQASTVFNTNSKDYATVEVSNYTQNPGCTSCWSSSVNANPGDVVSVEIYYHNTGSEAAQNTLIKLSPQSTGQVNSQTFSGGVVANNAGYVSGSATINLSSPQTFTYIPGTTRWYADNQNSSASTLLSGQNGSEAFSGGLSLGTIGSVLDCPNTNSFCHQGVVVFRFQVGVTQAPQPCVINSFTANGSTGSTTISQGSAATLAWSTSNCTAATISPYIGTVVTNGTVSTGSLSNSVTYILSATGNTGSPTSQVTVYTNQVQQQPCVINSFTASPSSIAQYSSSTLAWSTSNCTSASISNIGVVNTSGSTSTGSLSNTMTYTLTASGNSGNPSSQVTVSVNQIQQQYCTINSFYASPSSINQYDSATLYWSTNNCTSASISNIGTVNTNGSTSTGSLSNTMTYTLTAYGQNGNPSSSTTVYVNQNQQQNYCTINSFYASPSSLSQPGYSTLYWSTNNCTSVSISNVGSVNTNGSVSTGYISNTTTFMLTAYGNNGTQNSSTTVSVNNVNVGNLSVATTVATSITKSSARIHGLVTNSTNQNATGWFEYGTSTGLGLTTNTQSLGSTSSLDMGQNINGLTSNTTYYFRAVAQGYNGSIVRGNIESFTTLEPSSNIVYVTNNNTTVNGGGAQSLVALTITTPFSTVRPGDSVSYIVTYTNISKTILSNTVLNVKLPQAVDFTGSSAGLFSNDDHSLTWTIGTLNPKDTGTVTIQGMVNNKGENHDTLITTATLTYTLPGGAQDTAIAYATQTVNNGSVLGAFALGAGFFPGLLLILLIILIIILLMYFTRRRYAADQHHSGPPMPPPHH